MKPIVPEVPALPPRTATGLPTKVVPSPGELRALDAVIVTGKRYAAARLLGVSLWTIGNQLTSLFAKTGYNGVQAAYCRGRGDWDGVRAR